MTNDSEQDLSASLRERVLQAYARDVRLRIVGGGSKDFYGRAGQGEPLETAGHCGVTFYEPTELVLTARAGTRLTTVEDALRERGQMLGFEPPRFGPSATLGGAIACGLSGPRRPWAGAARDFVLGAKILNGKGEILSFGGQTMKNVAGFDVSRAMAGAMGTLGILLEISLKALPLPETQTTLAFEMDAEAALLAMNRHAGQQWPISAACHDGARLYLRLAGSATAIAASHRRLGGETLADAERFWDDWREQRLPFFAGARRLWRLALPSAAPMPALPGAYLTDWGGALRWLDSDAPAERIFAAARAAGGHALLFRGRDAAEDTFQPLPEPLQTVHIRLKRAFDPKGILNPGRLYKEW